MMHRTLAWLVPMVGMLLLAAGECRADSVNIVRLELTETEAGRYVLEADLPPMLAARAPRVGVPERFTFEMAPEIVRSEGRARMRAVLVSEGAPLGPDDELFAPWPLDGAFVVARWRDGSISTAYMPGDRVTGIAIEIAGLHDAELTTRELVATWFEAGVRHTLTTPVHLVLMLGVAMLGGVRTSALLVAYFGSGQALSMPVTEVTGGMLPEAPVAACVAVGAILIARAGLRGHRRTPGPSFVSILILLGLLHGLSVSGRLAGEGIEGMARVQALFASNVGVDAVHLMLVVPLAGLLALGGERALVGRVRTLGGYAAGAAGVALIGITFGQVLTAEPARQPVIPLERLGGGAQNPQSQQPVVQSTRQGLQYPCMSFVAIEPYEVRHEVLLRFSAAPMFGASSGGGWIEVDEQGVIVERALDAIEDRCVVRIDGDAAAPVVRHAAFAEVTAKGTILRTEPVRERREEAVLAVTLAYRTGGLPSSVGIEWGLFSEAIEAVPLTVTDPINVERGRLTPEAPAGEWVSKLHGYLLPTVESVAIAKPRPALVSVGLVVLGVGGFLARRRIGGAGAAVGVVSLALAGAAYPFARPAVDVPLLAVGGPSTVQASDVLKRLLVNIYRAFDHREEGAVFDRLAMTVEGEALTDIYLQNRRMLELEDRGGARVRVTEVEIGEVASVTRGDAGGLVLDASWTVSGSVTHFGHTHFRTNAHRAEVRLVPDGDLWKIGQIDIIDVQRTR
jgi:hypothetical protein